MENIQNILFVIIAVAVLVLTASFVVMYFAENLGVFI